MSELVVVKERISNDRARLLYSEFCHAWNKCSTKEKLTWFKDTFVLFGKVTFRRGKGLFQFAKKLATGAGPPRRFSSPLATNLIGFSGNSSILITLSRKIGPTHVIMRSIVMKTGEHCC